MMDGHFASGVLGDDARITGKTSQRFTSLAGQVASSYHSKQCLHLLQPPTSNRHVYWVMNEASVFLWHDLPAAHSAGALLHAVRSRLGFLASGADAVADPMDPLPFFALHFLQVLLQLTNVAAPRIQDFISHLSKYSVPSRTLSA